MIRRRGATARCLLALLALVAAGCATSPAPVTERGVSDIPASGYHAVRKGDTLYSIAWRYGVDWEQLARRNGLADPYTIRIGQRIRIVGPTVAAAPSASRPSKPARTAPRSEPAPAAPRPAPATPAQAAAAGPLRWDWPLEGEVVRGFELRGDAVNKGLDIRGAAGATVRTAARGQVVYAGTGLRGHSRLVIVKHDDRWLSAYAHDDEILVREGQVLAAGEQ
ncbi:MAG: LysM peptidoglycan-binding domain-containing protein, partial [Pseudomonadales bacterium]|nr:LysM peptidoglycan-binding domain-containing protein [Pseudomonadales bacterium]